MLMIAPGIALADDEIAFSFIRSSGPGGQNVNKVATAVQLRFDIAHSPSLPETVRTRLLSLSGSRVSRAGVLTITAQRFRSQSRNRDDALGRLVALVREAARTPKVRKPTRPTHAARRRRLKAKRQRGERKRLRGKVAVTE